MVDVRWSTVEYGGCTVDVWWMSGGWHERRGVKLVDCDVAQVLGTILEGLEGSGKGRSASWSIKYVKWKGGSREV